MMICGENIVGIRSIINDRRGGFMLEIVAVTDWYRSNPPTPISSDRLFMVDRVA